MNSDHKFKDIKCMDKAKILCIKWDKRGREREREGGREESLSSHTPN